jgi:O-acetyl-ADP-ribose deacetylase (regulator of RNase III)
MAGDPAAKMVLLMITFTQGNLLDADAEALVNTVNTVGVMGKGIALMFKEAFPENLRIYQAACKTGDVQLGRMLVTERKDLVNGPRWIINFPTKKHWRHPSKMEWIIAGLEDLRRVIAEKGIKSVALPPLGSGNGGLDWQEVRANIEAALRSMPAVNFIVYEPTSRYQNVAKRSGVEKLTPPRALVAELVRRYWILGIECTLLEIQKLAYFLGRNIESRGIHDTLDLRFEADKFGPYSPRLVHLLNDLDGSYLHCDRRLADAGPFDIIWFEDDKKDQVAAYLTTPEAKIYRPALEATATLIDGFQSPLGMELLATVDWLLHREAVKPSVADVKAALRTWPGSPRSAERKQRILDDRLIALALRRLGNDERPRT